MSESFSLGGILKTTRFHPVLLFLIRLICRFTQQNVQSAISLTPSNCWVSWKIQPYYTFSELPCVHCSCFPIPLKSILLGWIRQGQGQELGTPMRALLALGAWLAVGQWRGWWKTIRHLSPSLSQGLVVFMCLLLGSTGVSPYFEILFVLFPVLWQVFYLRCVWLPPLSNVFHLCLIVYLCLVHSKPVFLSSRARFSNLPSELSSVNFLVSFLFFICFTTAEFACPFAN